MLNRVYGKSHQSYEGCSVVREWHYLSKFKTWMEKQDWEGNQLDKDILIKGNKVYGPDTCVFVTRETNMFILDKHAGRGQYPTGVCYDSSRNKFISHISINSNGTLKFLGRFENPEEAHLAWLHAKIELAGELAEKQDDPRVAKALVDRYRRLLKPSCFSEPNLLPFIPVAYHGK